MATSHEVNGEIARRFMKCATEFSNTQTLADLGQSKIFKLLDLPQEEREEFISTPHEVNGELLIDL